jgi:transposase InsO family protein
LARSITIKTHARKRCFSRKIKKIFDEEHARAGAKRIAKRLNQEGIIVGRHRVARIMRANGWRAKAARKFKATTNSNHKLPVAPNLLRQNFSASRPNEKWTSDITYGAPRLWS